MMFLFIASTLALVTSLIGYYFLGALGNLWFATFLKFSILGVFILDLGLFLIFDISLFRFVMWESVRNPTGVIYGLSVILALVIPILVTIIALVVKEVSLWKRFVPLISWILSIFVIPIVAGTLLYLLADSLGEDNLVTKSARNITIPQFFSLGSFVWGLVGLVALTDNTKADENDSPIK